MTQCKALAEHLTEPCHQHTGFWLWLMMVYNRPCWDLDSHGPVIIGLRNDMLHSNAV